MGLSGGWPPAGNRAEAGSRRLALLSNHHGLEARITRGRNHHGLEARATRGRNHHGLEACATGGRSPWVLPRAAPRLAAGQRERPAACASCPLALQPGRVGIPRSGDLRFATGSPCASGGQARLRRAARPRRACTPKPRLSVPASCGPGGPHPAPRPAGPRRRRVRGWAAPRRAGRSGSRCRRCPAASGRRGPRCRPC